MIYKILFRPEVDRTLSKWRKSNPSAYKKFLRIADAIAYNPRYGIGHPEPLVKGSSVTYSRRITAHDRVVYDIFDDRVEVLLISVEGHYDDK